MVTGLAVGLLRTGQALVKNLLNPRTPAEAWNAVRRAVKNVERLLGRCTHSPSTC